jgi:hypothetical protein
LGAPYRVSKPGVIGPATTSSATALVVITCRITGDITCCIVASSKGVTLILQT